MNFYSIIVYLTPLYNFSWSSRSINTSWSNPHCPHESNTTRLTDYIWILFQSLWHWVSTVSCWLDVEWTIARFWWSLLFVSAFLCQAYQQEESGAKVKDIVPMLHQLTEWWVLIHVDLLLHDQANNIQGKCHVYQYIHPPSFLPQCHPL